MDPHTDCRLRARRWHVEALAASGGDRRAAAILAAATRLAELEVVPFAPGTRFAPGVLGCYERIGLLIHVASDLSAAERALVVAHEIGHHELHDDDVSEVLTLERRDGGDDVRLARLEGYSPRERKEVEAEAFAAELLCPADWLEREIAGAGRSPAEIAWALGVPERTVVRQAIRALLLPPLRAPEARRRTEHVLDATQAAAATWAGGPLLVEAGPGTGKTATLVGRVSHLLGTGVPASAILVLTFSNRAAAELRARAAESAPAAAANLWVGTFHSFGLEILHKWHMRVGRGPTPKVIDRDGALAALERNLDSLPLGRFRDLRDPAAALRPVLRAIERCKDEMVTPEDYAAAARAGAIDGGGDDVEAGLELAGIYRAYQGILDREDALDLGDLVMEAARLLEGHDDVARQCGERFAHVLVDEYQDVNAASVRFLRSLCGPGTRLWAVADARQTIYRFRGAHGRVDAFAEDHGGEVLALGHNYRSGSPVIAAFSSFSSTMRGGRAGWEARRGDAGSVRVTAALTLAGETAAVRDRIEELRREGIGYGDQAVLGRTHLTLDRVGAALEAHGVPLVYLGDLTERSEVRDLLSLVAVTAELGGIGLLRAASLPPYRVPREDAVAAIRWAAGHRRPITDALEPGAVPGISEAGSVGLAMLRRDLGATSPHATAWAALTAWLFGTMDYLASLSPAAPGGSRMRLAAVYQLLKLAAETSGRSDLLDRVRRIAALGDGREHGVVAPEAEDPDAVRLMTVHGAKGLEFGAVHLPMVAANYVPLRRPPAHCPPPRSLARLAMSPADHDAEERALFFVAMSRARDHLSISHAKRYTAARDAGQSPFMRSVWPFELKLHHDAPEAAAPAPIAAAPRASYPERDLQTYARCPARYRYEVMDGLAAVASPSAYRRLSRCVRMAVGQIERAAERGEDVDPAVVLHAIWAAEGPAGHRHEAFYLRAAERMVSNAAEAIRSEAGARYHRGEWLVEVGNGTVSFRPDRVIEQPWGAVTVQALRMRAPSRPGACEGIHALMLEGARRRFPEARVTVESYDLGSGCADWPDTAMAEDALGPYREAIGGIEKGDFAARPDPRNCPHCPFFFVCGT